MTLALNNARKSYTGNGVSTVFTGPQAVEKEHLEVKLQNLTTLEMGAPLTLNVHYTVTGEGDFSDSSLQIRDDTTVTLMVAPTSNQKLFIDLIPYDNQELRYPESGPFPAMSHAQALDLLVMRAQAFALLMRRTLSFPDGDQDLDWLMPLPSERRGKALAFADTDDAEPIAQSLVVSSFHFVSGVPSNSLGQNGDVAINDTNWNVYSKVSGAWVLRGTITGPTGAPGSVWYAGTGVPSNALGINGDYYMRTAGTIGDVYQKAGGVWSYLTNIRGASGSGTGDIVGPAGATNNYFVLFDGITGKLVKAHTGGPGALAVLNSVAAGQIDNGAVTYAKIAAAAIATATEIRNNTASKLINVAGAYAANEPVVVTFSGTWAPDLHASPYQQMTLTNALNMGTPTNAKLGQEVLIELIQDATGGRGITLPANIFELGAFTPSTGANKRDLISGIVRQVSPLRITGSYNAGRV